jgi:hypothetical protein
MVAYARYYPSVIKKPDWLVTYSFTYRSRIFHLYGDDIIACKGMQNLGLCSALRSIEEGGIFIVPHLLRHETSVFPVSSEGSPHSVASYDTREEVENLFSPRSSRGKNQKQVNKLRSQK